MDRIDEILEFWLGAPAQRRAPTPERIKSWGKKNEQFDREIRERFEGDLLAASRAEREEWKSTVQGCLARVIMFDQFARNMYRGTPRMFAFDELALVDSAAVVDRGAQLALLPCEQIFNYMPFMHAENLVVQERGVACFAKLNELPGAEEATVPDFLDYAQRHRDIVARFGRFPHRNALLGRKSTPQELQFLQQPGSSF